MTMTKTAVAKNTDAYIKNFPAAVQVQLRKLRAAIKAAAPKAEELISYGMPAFKLNGMLAYFAGYKNHVGFYPTAAPIVMFEKELAAYKWSKGAVQFPIDKPLPLALVKKMVQFKAKENLEKSNAKTATKKITQPIAYKKKKGLTDEEQVAAYMSKLDKNARSDIEALRKIIKAASPKLNERIKWNAPSYYYNEDIVTFGPYKTHKLLLVFHHPFIVKIKSALLEGDYKDRRLVHLKDKADAVKNKKEIATIINNLIAMIDKK